MLSCLESWRQNHFVKEGYRELCKRFRGNLIIGFFIVVGLEGVHHTPMGQAILDSAYDILVVEDFKHATAKSSLEGKAPISDDIRMVEFDEATYNNSQGQGFWTPRDLLGKCILKTVEQGAKVVVIDFMLKKPVPQRCSNWLGPDENDVFLSLLSSAIVLARRTEAVIIIPWNRLYSTDMDYTSRLKGLLDRNGDVVKQCASLGLITNRDGMMRHFQHFERYNGNNVADELYFSPAVLAACYLWHGLAGGDRIMGEAKRRLMNGEKEYYISGPRHRNMPGFWVSNQDGSGECLGARFLFRIAPREMINRVYGGCEDPLMKHNLTVCPAALLETNPAQEKIYRDKVVIIGCTNPKIGDMHLTPLGEMPGVFTVANGLNMLIEGLQIHDPSTWMRIGCSLMEIVFGALLFMIFHSIIWGVIVAVVWYFAFISGSTHLLSSQGVFMNFLLPVVGIGLFHPILAELQESLSKNWNRMKEWIDGCFY
jgi:hypothetical protein